MSKNVTTTRTGKHPSRDSGSARKSGGFAAVRSSDARKVVRDTISFYRDFKKLPEVRGILEDLSKS